MRLILLLPYACLILFVADRVRGFSSGAPEESCASLTVNHTHVGRPAPGFVCDATCRVARKLRLIGSNADNFTYSCNQSYQLQLTTTADVSLNGYMVAPREDTGAPLGPDVAYVGSWEGGTDIKLLCNGQGVTSPRALVATTTVNMTWKSPMYGFQNVAFWYVLVPSTAFYYLPVKSLVATPNPRECTCPPGQSAVNTTGGLTCLVIVSVNGTLLLTCNVSGSEPISYQWLKDGQQLQDDGRVSGSNDSMLVVDPVEGDDFGRYRCNASNDVDQVLSEVAMVAVAQVIVNLTASPSTGVPQGSPVNLTCEAVGGPTLNVTWTTPTGPKVGSFISVDSVTADDAGEYRCEVTSEAGTTNDSITIRVGVRVEIQPMNQSVSVNGRLLLTCNVSGSEPISYQWLKDGQQLQDDGRISGSNGSVLVVDPVEGDDFGGYWCNASNDVDQVQSEVAMVAVAPVIVDLTASPSTGVPQGSPLNLTCEAVGGPTLNVTWTTPTGPRVGSFISVDSVTADDAGEYRCEVTSEAGTTNDSITIRVGVRVVDQPEDQFVSVNGRLSLTCNVSGSEPISYQWLKDGQQLQDDGRVSGSNASVLVVDPVEGSDFGGYRCNASNDVDQVQSEVAVVAVAPVIVNLTASPFTGVPQGSPLNLTCEAVGGPTLNVTWTTPTGPRVGSVISVDNVTADNAGEYTCEVTTEAGTTNDSITIRVGLRVAMVDQPDDQSVSVNGTLSLTCNVSGSEPISYQWLKDGQQLQDDGRISGSNDSVLVVNPVEGSDFGGYRCNASNDVNQVLSEVAMVAVAPVIVDLTASPSTRVSQGSPLNLTCEAVGGPTLNVTWTTPTEPRVGSVISVDNVTADDAGEYTCEVTSEAGTTNDSITIRVGVRVEVQPMNQFVSVNDTLLLTCNVSGSEPISYQWLKDGQQLQDDGRVSGSNASVLVVDPVEGDDFGGYRCNTSNDVDQVQSEVAMVAVAPVIMNLTASPFTGVPQGIPLNLTCEAVGGPTLNVTWTTPTGPRVGSVISIDNVTADDAGEYRCEVMSEAGTTDDSITIRVGVRVEVQPMDQFVSVNGTLSLTCNVSGSEPISYQWLKDGEQLQDDGRVSGSNASVLVVDPVEGDDYGGYRCNASNDVDQVQSEVAMVAVAPNDTVVVTPATETLSVNGNVTFTCTSEGGPSNVFQWSFDGADLPGESGTLLSVTGVNAADGGTYRCTVSNAAGVDRDMATLFVNPILLEEPVDTNISLFEDGMLFCRARGFPVPEVLWYQNGTRLDVAALGNVNVTAVMTSCNTTSTLTITNATFDNSGRYFCSVTSSDPNVISVNSSEVDVIVRHTPEQPVNVTVTEVTPFSVALAWVEPHDNNAPINDYIITIGSVGTSSTEVRANASVEAFNVTDLRPFVNYTFTVAAENDLGEGLTSTPVIQRTSEFIPSAPLNLTVSAIGRRSVNVTWSPPANPNGILLFYQLEYSIVGQSSMTLDVPAQSLAASLVELTPAQVYQVTVRASTSVGFGDRSEPVTATTGMDNPSAPVNLTATNVTGSANSVTISWAPPLEPNGIILTYEVTVEGSSTPRNRREVAVTVFGRTTQNVSNTTTSVIIANLTSYSENTVTVVAYTSAGPGEQAMVMFRTGEDTPLAPRNLTFEVTSSQSINVSWTRPLFFRGQLLRYEIFFASSNHLGMLNITSPALADQNSTTFHLTGLVINTMYEVSVQAVTGAGPGENVTGFVKTDEDAPPPVMNLDSQESGSDISITWDPPGLENGEYFYRLFVSFRSTFSNIHPSRSEEDSFELVFARTGTNGMPFSSFLLINTSDDNRQRVAVSNTLMCRIRSSAFYEISLAGVNQLRDLSSASRLSTLTTSPTPATPVTNLAVVAVSNNTNFTLQVSWDLPRYPNGEIQHYVLQYRQLQSDMGPVSTEPNAMNGTEVVLGLSFVIHNLSSFTFFEVTVTANNSLPGFPTNLTVRTNASVPAEAPALPTGWYAAYECLTIPLLIPSEDTGILKRYDIIVFGPTSESSPNEKRRLELANMAINNSGSATVRSVKTFESLEEVMAADSPLELCGLSDDSQYFVFFRLEFKSDGSTALVTTSEVIALRTQPIALPVVLVLFSVALLAGVAVAVAVFFLVRRYKKTQRYKLPNNIPETHDHEMETGIYINRAVPQWEAPTSPIPVEEFPNHVKNLHSDDDYRFSEEYKNVEPNHNPTVGAFSNPANAQKNRYGNITCYDHSRVRLTPIEGVAGSDYINGNFLDGYKQTNAFIATQGPVPDSIVDFWRMVWEKDVPTIVMLTNLEERGRIKCHRYWPTEKTSIYGSVKVTVQEELELSDYTIRTFSVIMSGFREERIVTQFHFTTWPDFGVPSHPTPLLLFIRRVKANHPSNRGPIVVHCSAGVGRSGTFITLHTQMSRIAEEKNVDVFRFVQSMRSRRCLMVQTEAQYIFIHDAILEVLECGMTEVAARELPSQYKYLQTVDEASGKTLLQLELQRLANTLHAKKLQSEASKAPNKGKNRFGDILPFDDTRCRLTSVIGVPSSDYINASFISGYIRKQAFIATQGPLPDTVGDFWRMVWEYKCASIVMLTKEREGPRVRCHRYWPDGTDMYGQTQVVLLTENQYAGYIQREFKLIDTKDKSSLPVRQFQFTGWPEESGKTPEHGADLIDLIGQVQKWQRTAGERPMVVHCSGGSGRTGTYIAIANLLDRLKTEGVVDIFQTVRALRMQRPRMVHTLEQYRYCYTTVLEYLESFDLYANFK